MTKFPFTVNGVDFSDVVHKYGYRTNRMPVYSRRVTTLDGVDHYSLIRTKGYLELRLNPVPKERALAFCEALQQLPAEISYHSFQTGMTETESMTVAGMPFGLLAIIGKKDWLDGETIAFEQL